LNQLGNHGTLLILNTENRHLWVIAEQTGSSDPGLRHVAGMKTVNQNSLDQAPSRPATVALRDLMQKFIDLK
jgi:hypothetical protein